MMLMNNHLHEEVYGDRTSFCADKDTATLRASHLDYHTPYRRIISDVSCCVYPGKMLLIRGRNGCGKTTLLRLFAGLITPTKGDVLTKLGVQKIFLGHQNGLKHQLAVRHQLILQADIHGVESPIKTVDYALETLNLSYLAHEKLGILSAGYQRRVALAKVQILGKNKLWLLDEPYTNLDPEAVALCTTMLTYHLQQGGSIIATSHVNINIVHQAEIWLDA